MSESHPYFPSDAALPHYNPNTTPLAQLLVIFGAVVGVVVTASYRAAAWPGSRFIDRFAASWFGLCQ